VYTVGTRSLGKPSSLPVATPADDAAEWWSVKFLSVMDRRAFLSGHRRPTPLLKSPRLGQASPANELDGRVFCDVTNGWVNGGNFPRACARRCLCLECQANVVQACAVDAGPKPLMLGRSR